jgi:(p)ppGpp synthase/HD superfamily hydrolase
MNSERFHDALRFAADLHSTQFRNGTEIPYLSHLLAVAGLVMEAGGSEDEVIAALLHDAVEDQGGMPVHDEIMHRYGRNVADIVMGCTDDTPLPGEKKAPWMARKKTYIAHVRTATRSVRLVSNADKLHNARSIQTDLDEIGEQVWERFNASPDQVAWYYRSLADEFLRDPASPRLARDLDAVVRAIEKAIG